MVSNLSKILNTGAWDVMAQMTEDVFGTASDPSQIPITRESAEKLLKLHPDTILCEIDDNKIISWVVILPTSKELAHRFLSNEISERELMDMSVPSTTYEALYLCSAFTVPKHRSKGYATHLFKEAIKSIPHTEDVELFAWVYTEEGKRLLGKLRDLGREILLKKDH